MFDDISDLKNQQITSWYRIENDINMTGTLLLNTSLKLRFYPQFLTLSCSGMVQGSEMRGVHGQRVHRYNRYNFEHSG
jgi:hypothetical protein